jgi:hypothetical protein
MSYQNNSNQSSVFDLTNQFQGLSVNPNYSGNRDGRLGVPPAYSSPSYNPPVSSNGYYNAAGYTQYSKGGVYRKSRKMRKSRKSRKNNKRSRRYRKK